MDKGVPAAVVRLDEPEAFLVIEKFNGAVGHFDFLQLESGRRTPSAKRGLEKEKGPQSANNRQFATGSNRLISEIGKYVTNTAKIKFMRWICSYVLLQKHRAAHFLSKLCD